MLESLKPGDRVTLKEPLGILKTTDMGLVVEVYDEANPVNDVVGSKDADFDGGEFRYGVAFPALRGWISDYTEGPWLPTAVDLAQFHAGDVIPCTMDELILIDSSLRGVA